MQVHSVLSINVSGQEQIYRLESQRYDIGRSIRAAIRINHPEVSRNQAVIVKDDKGRYQLLDGDGLTAMSSNGTYVNGTRVYKHYLRSGDEIRFGSSAVSARFFTSLPPRDSRPELIPEIDVDVADAASSTQMFLNQP
ncbi:MAG: hypothetical protein OHK0012_22720 [Synechococcales cyanobacterium]